MEKSLDPNTLRKPRGFAAMDPARHREITSRGGKAAHRNGYAHRFTSEEARAACKLSSRNKKKAPSGP